MEGLERMKTCQEDGLETMKTCVGGQGEHICLPGPPRRRGSGASEGQLGPGEAHVTWNRQTGLGVVMGVRWRLESFVEPDAFSDSSINSRPTQRRNATAQVWAVRNERRRGG